MVSKTRVLLPVIIGTIVLGTLGLLFIPESIKDKNIGFPNGTLSIDNKTIKIEVADSPVARQRWLTFREDRLPLDSAMMLVYNKSDLYSLWLLNIEFNVDLVWLDEQANIVYIVKNAAPCKTALDVAECTYKSTKPAKYILAATTGFIEFYNITNNSRIKIISI
ncbi:MAG: DUF192 domain-containing protein [Thermoproteota archaeon]|nr:DUF192 domain-containing protein [Thermoproteota archaeon]